MSATLIVPIRLSAKHALNKAAVSWLKKEVGRRAKALGYMTLADAENWMINLRAVAVRTRKRDSLAHRFRAAGQYLSVKRYCSEVRCVLADGLRRSLSTISTS